MVRNFEIKNIFLDFFKLLFPKNQNKFLYFFSLFYLFNLSLVIVFGRPFVGLYIFGRRLGELYVLSGVLALALLYFFTYITKNRVKSEFKNVIGITFIICISFLVSLFINGYVFDLYIFKSSSYIWSLGYGFLGYYFLKQIRREIILLIVFLSTFALYFVSIINYPNFIIDIFISNSDKFQLIKAADSLLIFVFLNIMFARLSNFSEQNKFQLLMYSFGMFLPYYIYQSRGSLLAAIIFFILSAFSYKEFIFKNLFKVLIFGVIGSSLFYLSSFAITFVSVDEEFLPDNLTDATNTIIDEVLTEKETREGFLTFYIQDGRLFSRDTTTNWRLDIWQDLLEDLSLKNKLTFGFGYTDKFEIMSDPSQPGRLGRDGLNEHVHNYFFNIIGRGGLVQLILFLGFYGLVYILWIKKNLKSFDFFKLFIPVMIVSGLDVTMEGVHFPFIFFSLLGYILSDD
tara:strand:- start:71 stop:1438 length:1368 start_codon:yes stop_codon:yes gene_type:complete